MYEKNEEVDQVSNFALIAYDPTNFDEVIKEELWVKYMDVDIDAIEINKTWDLVYFLDIKIVLLLNGFARPSWMLMLKLRKRRKDL